MEDSIGNIIYIIISIIIIAVSAISRSKRKKIQQPMTDFQDDEKYSDPEESYSIKDFIGDIIDENEEEEEKEQEQEGEEETLVFESVMDDNRSPSAPENEEYIDTLPKNFEESKKVYNFAENVERQTINLTKQDNNLTQKEAANSQEETEAFDLQQAIIFSEILNRKEF